MYSTESPSLNDVLPELDGDSKHAPSTGGHRQKPGKPYRSSGVKNAQFRSDRPSISRRLTRKLARFFLVALIGVGGTLAWQHGDEVTEMVRTWAPSLGWLLPVSTIKAPAPTVTTADLQEQLKPVAIDLALVRRSIEQLGANQDQLARKQDQMAQAIATLQAAEQDISQKILALAPPAPKAV
ncbi:MAG: hypothetical protein WAL37_03375, partial [Xanthobacteraceae bacterium]